MPRPTGSEQRQRQADAYSLAGAAGAYLVRLDLALLVQDEHTHRVVTGRPESFNELAALSARISPLKTPNTSTLFAM